MVSAESTAKKKVVPYFGTTDSRCRDNSVRMAELKNDLAKLGDRNDGQSASKRTALSYKISVLTPKEK